MTLHYEDTDAGLTLHHGKNIDVLPGFPDDHFDSVVCDPPYELGFMGRGWDSTGIAYDRTMWAEVMRVLKPGGHLLAFGGSRTWHRMAVAIEDAGFELRDSIAWLYGSGFPKSMDVAKAIDKAAGAEREVTGTRTNGIGGNSSLTDDNWKGVGVPTYEARDTPATEDAKKWEGWGTALKPAFEPIVVARKPFRGTVAGNVLLHGTGALNIAATRVGAEVRSNPAAGNKPGGASLNMSVKGMPEAEPTEAAGRWPTNVVLDESQAAVLDAQTGVSSSKQKVGPRSGRGSSADPQLAGLKAQESVLQGHTDSGGASRFFPTFRYEAKAPGTERPNVDGAEHATVKPLDLMRWCVRLVTPPGGLVLDPFAGSGTTGEACLIEGFRCVLIEMEADHLPLIMQRVRKPLQQSLFGDF